MNAAVAYSASQEQATIELINMKSNPMITEIEERNLTWTSTAPRFLVYFFGRPAISFGNNGVDVEKAEVATGYSATEYRGVEEE